MITPPRAFWSSLLADVADLALGRACLVCDVPGRPLCGPCREDLRDIPQSLDLEQQLEPPERTPPMKHPPPGRFALTYGDDAARLILAYKEHGSRGLARDLGLLLADAIETLIEDDLAPAPQDGWMLACIPGHARPARGFDALGGIIRPAIDCLHRAGHQVGVVPLLRQTRRHRPLKTLDRRGRHQAVVGSMSVRVPADPAALAGRILVVDDVVTTGSTMREALRALGSVGLQARGIAALARAR